MLLCLLFINEYYINDVVKQGNRGGNQYKHVGYSYRVRVGKLNQPGHRDIHVPHDISFTQWYLICRKSGCRFVGILDAYPCSLTLLSFIDEIMNVNYLNDIDDIFLCYIK